MSTRRNGDRAVVLGGSMAGLLAARVLSDSFDEVVIVDRDALVGVTEARRGVPQGRHVHGLLARGQQILDELFPGFTQRCVDAGVPTGDLGTLRWFFNGRRLAPGTTGLTCVSAARPVLESHVRAGVEALPQVRFLERTDIVGLVTTGDSAAVTGVRVQSREKGSAAEELSADLVVDATGRGSRTPVWLGELGYGRPVEDRVKIDLSYTSQTFKLPDESILGGDLSINPVASPAFPRGAFFSRIENGLCKVSLTGVLGDSAPSDSAGFVEWTKTLPVPDVYEVLQDAVPQDEATTFHYPASVRRRYERLKRFPAGFLVLGDAACSFNPVYGQGMTVAALESLVLRDHLRTGIPDPLRFFKDIAGVIDGPWEMSTSGDLGFPEVEGKRSTKVKMANAYMAKMQAAATVDGSITRAFMRVAGLVDPAPALMTPRMIAKVLRGAKLAGAADQGELPRAA